MAVTAAATYECVVVCPVRRICDICGCMEQSTDNDERKQNHLQGRQHKVRRGWS